jgi:DHA1 family bicyclomycin/chloramphenicol resistance-like MFS transporter
VIPNKQNSSNRRLFFMAALANFIVGSSVDMFVPSLPAIHRVFQCSMQRAQLVVVVYIFAYGLCQFFAGSISDSFGRRRTLLYAVLGFIVATIAVPFCHTINQVLALRALEGMFAASIAVCARAVLSDVFVGEALAKYASYFVFAWTLGPILSPYLGGYLQHLFGWEAAFFVLAGYASFILVLLYFCLPETISQRHDFHFKKIIHNYKRLYVCWPFVAGAVICGCVYGFATMYNVIGPFLIEHVLHYNSVVYGRIALMVGVGWLAGVLCCRFVVASRHLPLILMVSLLLGLSAALIMLFFALDQRLTLWTASLPVAVLFLLGGLLFSYYFGACLRLFPKMGGAASAGMGVLYTLIAALVSSLSTFLQSTSLLSLACAYLFLVLVVVGLFVMLSLHRRNSASSV